MGEELQFLWYHMRGDFGYVMAIVSWITAVRLVFKPVTKFLEDYIQSLGADAAWAQAILSSRFWKSFAFLVDYLASVKLPSAAPKPEAPKQ